MFSPNSFDLLCILDNQVPRSLDKVILVLTTTAIIRLITLPLVYVYGVAAYTVLASNLNDNF